MAEAYIGYNISLKVGGGLGFYQGKVKGIDPNNQAITLTKVIHNGKPTPTPEVTICACDILSMELLSNTSEKKPEEHKKAKENAADKIAKSKKSIVQQNGIAKGSSAAPANLQNVNQSHAFHPFKSNTKEPNCRVNLNASPNKYGNRRKAKEVHEDGYGGSPRNGINDYQRKNDKRIQHRRDQRNETTFGIPLDDELDTEFDFEKNLALFDKQAVRQEIENLNRPDVVSQTETPKLKNYRWDENIIEADTDAEISRQIIVPASYAGEIVYATDNGLLVPSITTEFRLKLLSTAVQLGLTNSRQLEMIGRGATEIILSMIGGSRRLEPNNSHQPPIAVVLCGVHMQGAAGINCARQLEGHGVRTVVATPSSSGSPSCIAHIQEMKLFSKTSGKISSRVESLPQTVDLIIDARFDLDGQLGVTGHTWLSAIHSWASGSRAPVVALDPPSDTTPIVGLLSTRVKLAPILPLAHFPDKGKVYLLNVNIPQQVYTDLQIKFTTPFGAKMVIPLHSCE